MNLHDVFRANVARRPKSVAVRTLRGEMTFAELDQRSDVVAAVLLRRGVRPTDRVAVQMPNRPEFVEIVLGIAKVGATLVPLSFLDKRPQIAHILSDSGSCVFLFDVALAEAALAGADDAGVPTVCVGDPAEGASSYEDELAGATAPQSYPAHAADDLLYIGYTSGTTGKPKGVIRDHRSVTQMSFAVGVEWGLRPDTSQLITMPMCHSGGLWQLIFDLTLGITTCLAPSDRFEPSRVLNLLERWKVNWAVFVPTMSDLLIAEGSAFDFPALKVVCSGSAPMFSATKQGLIGLFPHAELNECYGATETGVATNLGHGEQLRKTRCVGRPLPGVEAKVVDPDGRALPPGGIGEIVVRSPFVFREYYGLPDLTARSRRDDGFVGVGDLAKQDDEGYFYIVDRKNDMIITGGLNVYPAEVEEVLRSHPVVNDVVVVGVPHEKWGEQVTAVVVASAYADEQILLDHCRRALPAYKIPKVIHFAADLPQLVSGKNSRRLVRERLEAGRC